MLKHEIESVLDEINIDIIVMFSSYIPLTEQLLCIRKMEPDFFFFFNFFMEFSQKSKYLSLLNCWVILY